MVRTIQIERNLVTCILSIGILCLFECSGCRLELPDSQLHRQQVNTTRNSGFPRAFTTNDFMRSSSSMANVFYPGETVYIWADISEEYPHGTPIALQFEYLPTGYKHSEGDLTTQKGKQIYVNYTVNSLRSELGPGKYEYYWSVDLNRNGNWAKTAESYFYVK